MSTYTTAKEAKIDAKNDLENGWVDPSADAVELRNHLRAAVGASDEYIAAYIASLSSKKYEIIDEDGELMGTFTDLKLAWLEVKADEGPLSVEPKTWEDLGDALSYCECSVQLAE